MTSPAAPSAGEPDEDGGPSQRGRADQLGGFRIGVTSDRRSQDLITALERRGAQVVHAPALTIAPNDQDGTLLAETRELIRQRPEVVLITTGYGMRRWLDVADAAGLGAELTDVLEHAQVFARGPKAVGAVRAAGVQDAQATDLDTTASLVDVVADRDLTGRRVAIQLHGYTDEVQLARLRKLSTEVLTVTPYRWVQPAASDRLPRLIEAAARGRLDAVVFTSAAGAVATLETAEGLGLRTALVRSLSSEVLAAAVGPVTAAPLRGAGIEPVVPDRHRLGALIRLVGQQLGEHRVERYRSGEVLVEVRGRQVSVDGRPVTLGPHALAMFKALARSETVVSRAELVDALPEVVDDHALEVAISRLRRSLDVPGLISTVVRRGYRLNAVRVPG